MCLFELLSDTERFQIFLVLAVKRNNLHCFQNTIKMDSLRHYNTSKQISTRTIQ